MALGFRVYRVLWLWGLGLGLYGLGFRVSSLPRWRHEELPRL